MEALRAPTRKTWGREWANLVGGCYMANPTSTFRAMAEGKPYPVKAFFSLGNNTLMAFANTRQIYQGLMNQGPAGGARAHDDPGRRRSRTTCCPAMPGSNVRA